MEAEIKEDRKGRNDVDCSDAPQKKKKKPSTRGRKLTNNPLIPKRSCPGLKTKYDCIATYVDDPKLALSMRFPIRSTRVYHAVE